jgi:hypothetical protein
MSLKVTWFDGKREPKCAPDPAYPNGMDIDPTQAGDLVRSFGGYFSLRGRTIELSKPSRGRGDSMFRIVLLALIALEAVSAQTTWKGLRFAGMAQEPAVTPEKVKAQEVFDLAKANVDKLTAQSKAEIAVVSGCVHGKISKKKPLPPGIELKDLGDAMQDVLKNCTSCFSAWVDQRCKPLYNAAAPTVAALNKAGDTLVLADKQLKNVDACLAVYSKTIDEKAADITTRESELIQACKILSLYPPGK